MTYPGKIYLRRCLHCKLKFEPRNSNQTVCGGPCAAKHAMKQSEKIRKEKNKELAEKLKTKSEHLKDLQAVFNLFIRLRDSNFPCISCGTTKNVNYHAGHYKSVGAYPSLRFNEDNVHKQCGMNCNNEKGGNYHEYRKGLILKIGIERVEALESMGGEPLKLSIPEIIEMKIMYKNRIKTLKSNV
jgi:hypothetical protein